MIRPLSVRPTGVAQIAAFSLPAAILVILGAWYFNRPSPPAALHGSLLIVGSETMRPVVTACAEAFMTRHPAADVIVRGGGSGDGVAALLHGMVDIAMASRPLTPRERDFATLKRIEVTESDLALDGIAIIVHRANPLHEIDLAQLRRIFAGETTQWQDLTAGQGAIRPVIRAEGSGTAALFAERVLEGSDNAATASKLPTNEAIVGEVATQPLAIGYTGLGALRSAADRVRVLAVRATPAAAAVLPTAETLRTGSYPLARRLALFSAGPPTGIAASFVAHCAGPPGQVLMQRAGYVEIAAGAR